MQKNKVIEIMKCFGIIGIVILHSVFITLGQDNELSAVLRSFCIKSLLILSGYVVYGKLQNIGWIKEKVIRRIPLILIFTGIYWVFGYYVGRYYDMSLGGFYLYNFATGFHGTILWYLWLILICYLLGYVFEVLSAKIKVPYYLMLLLFVAMIVIIPVDILGISLLKWYGIFFFAGYAAKKYLSTHKVNVKLSYAALLLFPISTYLLIEQIMYKGQWVAFSDVFIVYSFSSGESIYTLINIYLALMGALFTLALSDILSKIKYVSSTLVYIGGTAIGILVFHKMILELKLTDNYMLSVLIATCVSAAIYELLKRVEILDYLLFGGSKIPYNLLKEGRYEKASS